MSEISIKKNLGRGVKMVGRLGDSKQTILFYGWPYNSVFFSLFHVAQQFPPCKILLSYIHFPHSEISLPVYQLFLLTLSIYLQEIQFAPSESE